MKRIRTQMTLILTLTACTLPVVAAAAGLTAPIKVTGGTIQGVPGRNAAITVFKGIPYAAAPVGDLRWRAPQPLVAWQGVRRADQFGASCIQKIVEERKPWTHEFMAHTAISEDCLTLNVWTPAKSAGEKLAVYVYIHGGGNVEGAGAVPVYDGEGMAGKGIIVVTVNYRLGIFGFLAHPELTAEAPYHASGNYAELDLIAALQWVKENIGALGGDPARVTIGGQSAGSGHVTTLTAMPLAKGLFRGAISESGTSIQTVLTAPRTLSEGEKAGVAFAKAVGAATLADLRKLSVAQLTAPLPKEALNGPAYYGGLVDGYVLPQSLRETFEQGKQNDVATITGSNGDERGASPQPEVTAASYAKVLESRYGDQAVQVQALYPAANDAEAKAALNASARDHSRTSATMWAAWRAKYAKTKTYTYFWDHALPGPDAGKYGAFHTSEVPYAMNTLGMTGRPITAADTKIAQVFSSYWVNFVKTGDPNGAGLAHWPSNSERPNTTMELGDQFAPMPAAGSEKKLEFFEQFLSAPRVMLPL